MGSKSGICDKIMKALPNAENFYDLFGGGFAITHAAMTHKKYKNYFFNEIEPSTVSFIEKAINGHFNYETFKPKFVPREEFFEKKDYDPYVRIVWSFGNNQKDYLFSKKIEPYKKAIHNVVVFDEFNDTAKEILGLDKWPENIKHIKNKRLLCRQIFVNKKNRLQRLEQIQQLERLEMSSSDYRELKIKENSVVYCDPPYKGTAGYLREFDHESFYSWARNAIFPVFISEYQMPKDFKKIASIEKNSTLSPIGATKATEAIFVNQPAADLLFGGKQK